MRRNININILVSSLLLTIFLTINISTKIFVSAAVHQEEEEHNYLNKKDEYQYPILGLVNAFVSPAITTTNNINSFNHNIKKNDVRTHSTTTIAKGKPLSQKSEKAYLRSRKNVRGGTKISAYSDDGSASGAYDSIPSDSSMDFGDDDGKYAAEKFNNVNPSNSNSFFPKEVTETMDEDAPGDTKSEYTPKANDYFVEDKRPIILFDGVCNFCNEGVTTILKLDTKEHLRFAALQSDAGKVLLTTCGREINDLSSIVLVTKEGKCYTKSEAIAKIGAECDVPVAALSSLTESFIPEFIRDSLYDQISTNRYNIFGKRDQSDCRICDEMDGKYNDRFVQ